VKIAPVGECEKSDAPIPLLRQPHSCGPTSRIPRFCPMKGSGKATSKSLCSSIPFGDIINNSLFDIPHDVLLVAFLYRRCGLSTLK